MASPCEACTEALRVITALRNERAADPGFSGEHYALGWVDALAEAERRLRAMATCNG